MKQKKRNGNRIKFVVLIFIILVGITLGYKFFTHDGMSAFKSAMNSIIYGNLGSSYNGKSLVVTDLEYNDDFLSKKLKGRQLPASLAKLFVIEYANTMANLDEVVEPDAEAIAMIKQGSSVADITTKRYYLRDLYAAMLVPSGNDAAYVVADYCGGKLSPQAENSQERISAFIQSLNEHMQEQGYKDTLINDPSGYDTTAYTTVLDLKSVSMSLIKHDWFKDIVCKPSYTATLVDGTKQTWKNTNEFLDSDSDYYNEDVWGIKTGSLANDYNLVVLYRQHGREFLICSLGSQTNNARYDDVKSVLQTIEESYYLKSR